MNLFPGTLTTPTSPEKKKIKDFKDFVELLQNAAVRDVWIFDHAAPCSRWLRRAVAVVAGEHEEAVMMEGAMAGRHQSELW